VHIDITEIRLESQTCYLFVGIDRVCKYAYIELHERMTQERARDFQKNLGNDCPFKIHTQIPSLAGHGAGVADARRGVNLWDGSFRSADECVGS